MATTSPLEWTDSHCHVGFEGVGEDVIDEAAAAGVTRLVTVGTDAGTSARAMATARGHSSVFATVGLHPHEARHGLEGVESLLEQRAPEVVAVGECGLDYYYDHSERSDQRDVFAAQVALAHRLDLALVVHTRDAWDDTLDVLRAVGPPPRWVVHCFSGGAAEARLCLDLGAHLSFSGIVTFKNAGDVREAAVVCPSDRLLVETDSPYLAPAPNRGRPNRPAWVALVGRAVAEIRSVPVEEVARTTWQNTTDVFALPER